MVDIKTVITKLNGKALGGAKIPHSVSNPVLRMVGGVLYIATFVYTYNRDNLQQNRMPRPIHWMIADVSNGDLVKEYDCRETDFSSASFDGVYDLNDPLVKRPSREAFVEIYSLFDAIRSEYLDVGRCNTELYRCYLDRILEVTPRSYQKFYQELSNLL